MPDELKKVTSSSSADQTDLAYQEQLSQEDVERAEIFLEQQYFGCELTYEIIDDYAIFRDDQDEVVGWITPDGTVCAICDDELVLFHISELGCEEEITEDDWYYAWEDLFSDESENTEYTWTPTSSAPTQNSAAKFSDSGQTYTQYLAPCAKVSDSIDFEDASVKKEDADAPAKAIDVIEGSIRETADAIVDDNDVNTIAVPPETAVGDEELPSVDYEISALEKPAHTDMPYTTNRSDDAFEATTQKNGVSRSPDTKKADSEQSTSVANVSEAIFAQAAKVAEERNEAARELSEGLAPESPRAASSAHAAKALPLAHDTTRELSAEALPKDFDSRDVAPTKRMEHVGLYSDVIAAAAKNKNESLTSMHSTGADALCTDSDPFAIACAHAAKGGPPYFSHLTSPVMISSIEEMDSRQIVQPARHSDGHNERQGHDREGDDQGSSRENGSFEDAEEDDGAFC